MLGADAAKLGVDLVVALGEQRERRVLVAVKEERRALREKAFGCGVACGLLVVVERSAESSQLQPLPPSPSARGTPRATAAAAALTSKPVKCGSPSAVPTLEGLKPGVVADAVKVYV